MSKQKTYITTSGETPDQIAYNLWGNETLFHHLVAANPVIRGKAILSGGLKLVVPDIETSNAAEVLPPWKTSGVNNG